MRAENATLPIADVHLDVQFVIRLGKVLHTHRHHFTRWGYFGFND